MSRSSFLKKAAVFLLMLLLAALWVLPGSFVYASPADEQELASKAEAGFLSLLAGGTVLQKLGSPSLPAISQEAVLRGLQPAALQNIHLKLKPGVEWLSEAQAQALKEHASGGRISAARLPGVEAGKIYVDPYSLISLEFVAGEGEVFYILLADEDRVVEEISVPEQTVFLNEANISYLAPGVNVSAFKQKSGTADSTGFTLTFQETYKLPGYDQEGKLVQVALKGYVTVNSPAVEVKYTENSGYKFIFMAAQRAEVQAELLAN